MQRQRGGLVPIGDALSGMGGPVKAIREASPQARHHFTLADQVNQLVSASEADPDLGFMARLMALCSLPRTNPGHRKEYKRVNGPYTLYLTAIGDNKLPYGSLPRLLLAWVTTEAVRTQSRELVLGKSLSEFMRKLGLVPVSGGTSANLQKQIRNAQARVSTADRKRRTRRLILMGSYLEHVTQDDPERKARLMKELDGFLERDRDRGLFDLPPQPGDF